MPRVRHRPKYIRDGMTDVGGQAKPRDGCVEYIILDTAGAKYLVVDPSSCLLLSTPESSLGRVAAWMWRKVRTRARIPNPYFGAASSWVRVAFSRESEHHVEFILFATLLSTEAG